MMKCSYFKSLVEEWATVTIAYIRSYTERVDNRWTVLQKRTLHDFLFVNQFYYEHKSGRLFPRNMKTCSYL